ncbi:MAG: malto-oligosyltrehalose trehalohydrolase, partial [bacterium]
EPGAGRDFAADPSVVSGTFESALSRLPELVQLGVTHIEIMPVATSSGERGWGYDGAGLYAPFEAYGGPAGLKALVNGAHELGLAVCLDCVYNHLGPEGNYLGKFGPYFTDAYSTPWGDAVNFDHGGADEVRAFVLDNLEQWFKHYHIDAVRLDAVHALYDESAVHILEDMAGRARRLEGELGKPLQLIAESNMNNPSLVSSPEAGGTGLDAQWSDDFHHCVHTLLTGEHEGYYRGFRSLRALARSLTHVFVHSGEYSPARGRHVGRPVGNLPRSRFVHCSQNHDQVGNRAAGERICHLVSADRAKIAAAVTILQPAVPMLFQGEEWAASSPFQFFTDHRDPGLGEAVTRGRCNEFVYFGWSPEDVPDPQDPQTFSRSMLDWSERARPGHREMLHWYRSLIALRRNSPELAASSCTVPVVRVDEKTGVLSFRRGRYLIALRLAGYGSRRSDEPGPDSPVHINLLSSITEASAEYGEVSGSGWSFERGTLAEVSRAMRRPEGPASQTTSPITDARAAGGLILSCGGAGVSVGEQGAFSVLELPEDSLAVIDLGA